MKLNEYLTENGVKLMIKGSGENYPPRQTNDLGMYDYAEGLENVIGKMAWICDYRANADPTKKPIRNIKPTPVVLTPPTVETVGFPGLHFVTFTTHLPLTSNAVKMLLAWVASWQSMLNVGLMS